MKKLWLVLFFFTSIYGVIQKVENEGWAKTYKQVFSSYEMKKNTKKEEVLFSQTGITPFTQLIFSWNALRPTKDFFTFFVQVRDARTKEWFSYHKMVQWGDKIQKSYFSRSGGSSFNYARLELEMGRKADGFRIKAQVNNKDNFGKLKALIVTTSDYAKFQSEPYLERAKNLKTFVLSGVPKTSQILVDHPRADVLCSPTSMSMMVGTLKRKTLDPLHFADFVYDEGLDAFGNWAFNTAHAYEYCHEKVLFYPTRLHSFSSLYNLLQQKIPVVVSVRGPLKGAPKPYEQGHLLVVIGYDAHKKEVICHDPAFDEKGKVLMGYNIHDFVVAWERSRRLAYKAHLLI